MRLPTLKQLEAMPWQDAWAILEAHERDERATYENPTLSHWRGRAYARELIREKLKRIERMRVHLGL
ncbi:hypothetical protein [Microvirga thermotolerans]|uniref:Uncharacterized protein n=1 Tax=Microvirga thermotolerans TaxID=2651334 RepID=A0A5P9JTQ6_9HYPH|nr:hypothetical protein [Microvirga thermotolerans]QFU15148.1 hypothetical protein GDR74_02365 [Microvirga thermotolerans]